MNHAEPEVRIFVVVVGGVAGNGNASGAVDGASRDTFLDLDGVSVVGDRFKEMLVMTLAFLQSLFGAMAFNGVGDGTDENVAIDLAFDEIILGAFPYGFDRHGFVVGSAQDDHGHSRSLCAESLERIQALAVGQGQIRK